MTKYSKKNKALKAVMAGAVAFTPVIAVGINVEKASAANEDVVYADFIKTLYSTQALIDGRSEIESAQSALVTVLTANDSSIIKSMLDGTIVADSTKEDAAVNLVTSLLSTFSPTNVDENFSTSFQTFKNVNKANVTELFGSTINDEDLGKFAMDVHLTYYNLVSVLPASADTEAFIGAYGTALSSYPTDPVYIALKSILKNEAAVIDALNTANNDVQLSGALGVALPILVQALKEASTPIGGGGGATPIPVGEVISDSGAVESNPQSVIDDIKNATTVSELVISLTENTDVVNIPVTILNALSSKNSDASVVVTSGGSSYSVPVSLIDVTDAATQLGVASAELKMVVTLDAITNPLAGQAGIKVLSGAIDFKLALVAPDGKSVDLSHFARPVQRSITANADLNPLTTVGVVVHADGSMSAVPTFVPTDNKSANLYRNTNSVYTLIENSKTFLDVDKGSSWAELYVEKLASRMIVNGVNDDSFKPTQMISRGEFAAILARGLGLVAEDMTAKDFKDVSSSQGFNKNGEIAAVVDAGLVKGFENSMFRPYDEITRDQAAIMISRAIDYINSDLVKLDATKKLSNFKDINEIGAASRTHVEKVYQAGYLDGFTDDTFRPANEADRAQMSKILYNFLASIEYIN